MKYNAFISYRHSPLDMEIAKKVHTGLETYKIPKSVQKRLGIKKIKRVFRDQEELPIGSNLSDNIGEALKESEHLIVICSPRTPESEWVQKEIETFISLHGRENVLAVLVEGEPNESFPELLLNDENGNPVEPLAADVRGETRSERNKKFKTELLRLVAPVIGCSYDDLRQRHRERVVRRTVSIVSAVAGIIAIAGIAFGLYHANVADKMTTLANEKAQLADEKTQLADEILQEYRLKQENQSRFLAQEALTLYENGEREDAALVAIAGLPGKDNDRPYVADAEYALSKILHVYDVGEDMSFDRTLHHDLMLRDHKLSTDHTRLLAMDSGYNVYVWNTETWELCTKIAPEIDERNYLMNVADCFADATGVYTVGDNYFTKYDFDGNKLYTYTTEAYLKQTAIIPERNSGYLFCNNNAITVIDLETGRKSGTIEMPVDGNVYTDLYPSRDNKYLLFEYRRTDSEIIEIGAYNLDKNELKLTRLSEDYPLEYAYTALGNVAVVSTNNNFFADGIKNVYLDVINPQTGRILWSREIPCTINYVATFELDMKAHSYTTKAGETFSEIVITVEDEAFTFNELDSKIVAAITLPDRAVSLNVRSDNAFGFVGMESGNIETIDFHEGRIYSDNTIKTKMALNDLVIMDGKVAIRPMRSSTLYIMKYHTGSELQEINTQVDYFTYPITDPKGSDYFVVRVGGDGVYKVISKEGAVLATVTLNCSYATLQSFFDDTVVLCSYDTIYYANVKTGEVTEVTYESLGIDGNLYDGYATDNGRYAVFWATRKIVAIDLANKSRLMKGEGNTVIGNAVITEDGSTVLVAATGSNLSKVDLATLTETTFESDSLREFSDAYSLQFLAVSHDGKTAAMCCMDGKLRLVNVADGSIIDEFEFNAKSNCSLFFTKDDKYLMMQGDSLTVKIRDIENKSYKYSFDASSTIKRPIQANDGYIAVCDSAYLYLIETENYGVCAIVLYGGAYIPSDKVIIIADSGTLYKAPYRDYKALIEEAERQFPGAKLTDEEKAKYNLN